MSRVSRMLIGSLIGDPNGVARARSGPAQGPKWAIGDLAAAASAHHRPSSAAHLPTLHQVVRRASSAAAQSVRRPVFPGPFPDECPAPAR